MYVYMHVYLCGNFVLTQQIVQLLGLLVVIPLPPLYFQQPGDTPTVYPVGDLHLGVPRHPGELLPDSNNIIRVKDVAPWSKL